MTDIARLALDTDTSGLARGERGLDSIASRASKTARDIGKSMQGLGTKLSIGVTAPLAFFGKQAIQSATQFQSSMSDVSTLIDTNTESLEKMSEQVLEISKRTPVALEDLTSALFDVRSAGIKASDAMDVLEQSARLGVAGLGSTKEATDLVTSAINAFNIQGADQAQIYDTIFKATKNGKTTISELSQNFGAVAGTVAKAGIELDDYLASVSALTTTGLPAAQAHTQIRAAISGLTRETELSRSVFQGLGAKDFPDLIEKSGGLVNAFDLISNQLGNNDADIIKLVGSVEAYNAIVGLTGGQNEAFVATLADMRSGIDGVSEAFDKQNNTPEARAQRTKNAMEQLSITIGSALLPAVEQLTNFLTGVANAFSELDEDTQSFLIFTGAAVAVLGPLLLIVGSLVTFTAPIVAFSAAFLGFGAASAATATGATAAGFAVKGLAASLLPLLANPIVLGAAAIITGIYLAWKYWDDILPIIQSVGDAISAWWTQNIQPTFDFVIDKVIAIAGIFAQYIGDQISAVIKVVTSLLRGDFSGAISGIKDIFFNAVNAAWNIFKTLAPNLAQSLATIASNMISYGKDIINGLIAGIKAAPQAVWNALKSVVGFGVDNVKSFLGINSPSKLFMGYGENVTEGFVIGIEDGTPAVKRATDALVEAANSSIDKLKTNIFEPIVTVQQSSIEDLGLNDAIEMVSNNVAPAFRDKVANPLLENIERISRGFADMVVDVEGSIKGLVSSFKNGDIVGVIVGVADTISSIAGAISGISGGFSLPRFARGTSFAGGGLSMVGEEGPELVNLPRGSQVFSADKTKRMMNGGGDEQATQQVVIINNSALADAYVDGRSRNIAEPIGIAAAQAGSQGAQQQMARRRRKAL